MAVDEKLSIGFAYHFKLGELSQSIFCITDPVFGWRVNVGMCCLTESPYHAANGARNLHRR